MAGLSLTRRQQNSGRPVWKSVEAFKQWVRGWNCACDGRNPKCSGKTIAAHVDYAGKGTPDAKGMGTKAADRWCIPLSANCHWLQHNRGWPWFDKEILGAPGAAEKLARKLWSLWPGRLKWEESCRG